MATEHVQQYIPLEYDPEEYGLDETEHINIYEHYRLTVDPGQTLTRVDIFLANRLKHITRSRIKNATLAGFVKVNNQPVKASYKVKPYDEISIILPYPPAPDLQPEDIPLNIIYEDEYIIVINKQAGLVCHPGCGNFKGTLINALLYHFKYRSNSQLVEPTSIRPGLVHRIDKDTTGILVIAKTELAYTYLAKQFYERTTHRYYYALVWGNVKQDKGTIIGHISRSPSDRKKFIVIEDGSTGKPAVTHYQVLQRFGICTLVRCKLETGRTHQIRVHFKYLGHTLFGDTFYGGNRILKSKPSKSYQRFITECLNLLPRQALHAKTLSFIHPITKKWMHFDSDLPQDFMNILTKMAEFTKVELNPEIFSSQPIFEIDKT
ncbi:MAG: RluA family pseudouridine synthase [Bacteroidia bacterium]|nr:RluA family pseudouridine synthase [Bacteroidia bacterium]MDW8157340.1 RluA family pseudouridine synthase [Bacteroidia bacterium]